MTGGSAAMAQTGSAISNRENKLNFMDDRIFLKDGRVVERKRGDAVDGKRVMGEATGIGINYERTG